MKKLLNLKNMKETIVNYSSDQKEFDKIWDALYEMACIGFIDSDFRVHGYKIQLDECVRMGA